MNVLEIVISAILGAAGGAGAVFTGLSSFLGRIWADRIHRAHFETEFAALRDIWQKVARVRAVFGALSPLDDADPHSKEVFEKASEAVGELVDSIDSRLDQLTIIPDTRNS
jgi:hypothetical protein